MEQAPSSEHYKKCAIEPITYIEANRLGFHEGNIVKYITRYEYKGGMDDLKKAKWYIERLIEREEKPNDQRKRRIRQSHDKF